MKWTCFYKTEADLVADLLVTESDVNTVPYYKLVRGYGFVDSFKKYFAKHGQLTPKQMTQAKRLAGEIYRNVHGESAYCAIAKPRW